MLHDYKEFKDFLNKEILPLENKPKLLLHTCCAPCSSYTLLFLMKYFNITIFYSNDNISPESEYELRLNEQIKFASKFNIKVLYDNYNNEDYNEAIKGYEHMGEKSSRCYRCYKLRLLKTCKKAKELGFEYFTTSLSISPYKISRWINEIGYELENEYQVKFLYSDFKKEEGYKQSIEYSKEYNLYRQDYCGCKYSLEERRVKE